MYQRVGEYVTLYVALNIHFLLVSFKFKDIQNVLLKSNLGSIVFCSKNS